MLQVRLSLPCPSPKKTEIEDYLRGISTVSIIACPDKTSQIMEGYQTEIYHMQKVSIAVIKVTHLKPNLKKMPSLDGYNTLS